KNFDTDENNILSKDEINAVERMVCSAEYISNLKGIEYFTKLTRLQLYQNLLTSIEVSKNTELTFLDCSNNDLTSLDVSKNTKLTTLWCDGNELTSLDVSKNTALENLNCSRNKLTELDVSKNMNLTYLYCQDNKIKGAKMLALVNSLPKVSGSKKGEFFVIDTAYPILEGNVITKPQVAIAKNKNWIVYDYRSNGNHIEYEGSVPEGIAIDATNFPDEKFRNYVSAKTIDKDENGYLNDEEIAAVKTLDVNNKQIANLKGIEFFTALERLFCQGNPLKSLDVSKNTKLKELYSYYNELTELDVSKNTNLTRLTCYRNQISGDKMQALVESLPEVESGTFSVFKLNDEKEKNVITKSQVALAISKGWKVLACEQTGDEYKWYEYAGSDDTPTDPKTLAVTFTKATTLKSELSTQDTNALSAVIRLAEKGKLSGYSLEIQSRIINVLKKGTKILFVAGPKEVTVPDDVTSEDNIYVELTDELRQALLGTTLTTPLASYNAVQIKFEIDNGTTGIDRPTPNPSLNGGESWYTIDGKRLSGEPTKKGVYIVNGKKVVK
ncbi:MAG: leucine-rich repeat domain-containing protein, partial [Prevotella sp.]|nr:leucine-rich repeat domain-containing protein [Prevotella sp.]